MRGEKSIDKANLIRKEQPEAKTQQTRGHSHTPIPPSKFSQSEGQGGGDHCCDQHHSDDRTQAKEKKIGDGP